MDNADDVFLPTKRVRARYGNTTDRTIDRWIGAGILPQPEWIGGRRYWRLSTLERAEREGMAMARKPGRPPVRNTTDKPLDAA